VAIPHGDSMRLLDALLARPLVEGVGWHEASLLEGLPKRRVRGDRLGSRIDRLAADLPVLRPVRDEPQISKSSERSDVSGCWRMTAIS
jgi:hypothetical protein